MSILPKLSDVLADNPVHKLMQDLQQSVRNARTDLSSLACSLSNSPTCNVSTPASIKTPPKPSTPAVAPSSQQITPVELPTEEDTIIELKKRLGKEIAKAENDLTNKLKIPGRDGKALACQCLENKHNMVIEGISEELIPKEPNNAVYRDIIEWFEKHEPMMTYQASASGKYDEDYIKYAGDLGEFRRRLSKSTVTISSASDFLKNKRGN
jgi:hypothetical protein